MLTRKARLSEAWLHFCSVQTEASLRKNWVVLCQPEVALATYLIAAISKLISIPEYTWNILEKLFKMQT